MGDERRPIAMHRWTTVADAGGEPGTQRRIWAVRYERIHASFFVLRCSERASRLPQQNHTQPSIRRGSKAAGRQISKPVCARQASRAGSEWKTAHWTPTGCLTDAMADDEPRWQARCAVLGSVRVRWAKRGHQTACPEYGGKPFVARREGGTTLPASTCATTAVGRCVGRRASSRARPADGGGPAGVNSN